ncbi:MAG: amidohydrolase family protein, partial [Gemmatimonadota bacterium]
MRSGTPAAGLALTAAMLCSAAVPAHAQAVHAAADLILTGGRVRTPAGWAEALAVRQGVIVAVGDAASVRLSQGPKTAIVDLRGGTVLPGLHDTHVHPLDGGITARRCKVPQGSDLAATQRLVKACASRARPDEWILGGQWDAPALGGIPDRRALDAIAAARTANGFSGLMHNVGHCTFV